MKVPQGKLWPMAFSSIYRTHLRDEMPTFLLDGHIDILGRPLHKFSRTYPHTLTLWWVAQREFVFGRHVVGWSSFVFAIFKSLYDLSWWNLTILVVLGNFFPFSWNLDFYRNLNDMEIENLKRLVFSLASVQLSPSVVDSRTWSISYLGSFSVKKNFLFQILSCSFQPIYYYYYYYYYGNQKAL